MSRILVKLTLVLSAFIAYITCANASDIFTLHNNYREHAMRRHNDIQGVESVYDDYRRNWLSRYNSEIQVGGDTETDTPRCSKHDEGISSVSRVTCDGNHVFRTNFVLFGATDNHLGSTDEVGALGYIGYEYIRSRDGYIGIGATVSNTDMHHALNGNTLDVKSTDYFVHFHGGYNNPNNDISAYWNISIGSGTSDTVRNSTITGSYDHISGNITGLIEKNYDITPDWDMSLALDYSLNAVYGDDFVDSTNTTQQTITNWNGDFTLSALFTKPLETGEFYTRLGATAEVLNPTERPIDVTIDAGLSKNISDATAWSGSIGGTYRQGGYFEGRAALRLLSKF